MMFMESKENFYDELNFSVKIEEVKSNLLWIERRRRSDLSIC